MLLLRLLTTPLPYYRASHLTSLFNENRSFDCQRDDDSIVCQFNEDYFNPYETSQELIKKAVAIAGRIRRKIQSTAKITLA